MTFMTLNKTGLFILLVFLSLQSCKGTISKLSLSTCKSFETNSRKCSKLVADELQKPISKKGDLISEGEIISEKN